MRLQLALIVAFALPAPAGAEQFLYTSHVEVDEHGAAARFVIDTDQGLIRSGHTGAQARICGRDEPYVCVVGDALHFSFPRTPAAVGDTWLLDGVNYTVASTRRLQVFGKDEDCFIVVNDADALEYYFSGASGLVAVRSTEERSGGPNFFVTSSSVGFPGLEPTD